MIRKLLAILAIAMMLVSCEPVDTTEFRMFENNRHVVSRQTMYSDAGIGITEYVLDNGVTCYVVSANSAGGISCLVLEK